MKHRHRRGRVLHRGPDTHGCGEHGHLAQVLLLGRRVADDDVLGAQRIVGRHQEGLDGLDHALIEDPRHRRGQLRGGTAGNLGNVEGLEIALQLAAGGIQSAEVPEC